VNGQQPNIRSAQQPYPYIANSQTPFTYQYRSPFTYARQGRTPFTYAVQTPANTSSQQPLIAQRPYIFDGIDGDDSNPAPTTTWGPGAQAQYTVGSPAFPISTNRAWDKAVSSFGTTANSATAFFRFTYGGTTSADVDVEWAGTFQPATKFFPVYEDTINHHSPSGIDSTWSWEAKWNSTGDSNLNELGISFAPHQWSTSTGSYKAKDTYYNIWNGSSTSNLVEFKWRASVGNQGESEASVQSTGVVFTVKVSKTGQTSLYTSYSAGTVRPSAFNTGGGGGGGFQ